jgi:hypothetical protein
MVGVVLECLFFGLTLALSIIPFVVELFLRRNQRDLKNKPKWYKPMILLIIVSIVIIGFFKTISDTNSKQKTDSLIASSKFKIDTLNQKVDTLTINIDSIKIRDSVFQKTLLSKFNIKRDELTNQPIFIGVVDNRHTNNTRIHSAENVDIH